LSRYSVVCGYAFRSAPRISELAEQTAQPSCGCGPASAPGRGCGPASVPCCGTCRTGAAGGSCCARSHAPRGSRVDEGLARKRLERLRQRGRFIYRSAPMGARAGGKGKTGVEQRNLACRRKGGSIGHGVAQRTGQGTGHPEQHGGHQRGRLRQLRALRGRAPAVRGPARAQAQGSA